MSSYCETIGKEILKSRSQQKEGGKKREMLQETVELRRGCSEKHERMLPANIRNIGEILCLLRISIRVCILPPSASFTSNFALNTSPLTSKIITKLVDISM